MIRISNKVSIPEHEIAWQMVRAQGPGGQHVNKSSTAVQLFFDVSHSSLPRFYKERLLRHNDHHITEAGLIVIKAQESRSQENNREDAIKRLRQIILAATATQKMRRPTKPTRASQRRRIESKKQRGEKKSLRRKPDY